MLKIGEVFCNKSVDRFYKIVEIHPDETLVSVEEFYKKDDYIKYLGRFIWESYKIENYLIKINRIIWYKIVRTYNINISKTCKKK